MTTFLLIHGAGDTGWSWHRLEAELRDRGHHTIAPDLPANAGEPTLWDYADVATAAAHDHEAIVVVGHSFGAFTAPLVAVRRAVAEVVLVAPMVPSPGESADEWWSAVGYAQAVQQQSAVDGGQTAASDPYVAFYHDVPRALADEALRRERDHPSVAALAQPWPLDEWPRIPTRLILGTEDRFLPRNLLRRLADERLGVPAEEIIAGHCIPLGRPKELADLLAPRSAAAP